MANVTIRDVAQKAGVGVATVSRVINQSPSVSKATRKKVQAAINELEFTPSPFARRLSQGKTMTIAVLAPFLVRPSYIERLRGVESVLTASDYDFVFYNVETVIRRDTLFNEISLDKRVDGLLLISISLDDRDAARFQKAGLPVVLIDTGHPTYSCVVVDDVAGGYQATRYLIELGHKKIGYISDNMQRLPVNFQPVFDRSQGYRNALDEAGIAFRPEYYLDGELSQGKARQLAINLLTLPDPPTAIFAYSDTQASGVLQAAHDLNLKVPEQLSIIGYDDIELAEYLHLTTIRQNLYLSGVKGAELMLTAVSGDESAPQKIILPTEIVVRRTTAPPAK